MLLRQHNKKAAILGYKVQWFIRMIITIIIVMTFVILINRGARIEFETFDAKAALLAQRLLYERGGLSYVDENTNRLYPGIIDGKKFSPEEINNTKKELLDTIYYGEDQRQMAARIILRDKETSLVDPKVPSWIIKNERELFYNKDQFENWEPLRHGYWLAGGPSRVLKQSFEFYVLERTADGQLEKRNLAIEVLKQLT